MYNLLIIGKMTNCDFMIYILSQYDVDSIRYIDDETTLRLTEQVCNKSNPTIILDYCDGVDSLWVKRDIDIVYTRVNMGLESL